MKMFLVATSLVLISVCSPARSHFIYGSDDRLALTPGQEHVFSSVGVVLQAGVPAATGTVAAGGHLVLTNAHVFYAAGKPRAENFAFRLPGETIAIKELWVGSTSPETDGPHHDWAIALLHRPASIPGTVELIGPAGPEARVESGAVVNVAFHKDRRRGEQKLVAGCSLFPREGEDLVAKQWLQAEGAGLLLHDCDTRAMASGSPLLVEQAGIYRLVAIHSCHVNEAGVRDGNGFDPQRNASVAIKFEGQFRDTFYRIQNDIGAFVQAANGVNPATVSFGRR